MTSMTSTRRVVTVGVDTHSDVHHAAAIDEVGRPLADAGFPTTPDGYRRLLAWAAGHGWRPDRGEGAPTGSRGRPIVGPPPHRDQARSNRSRFMTLFHAATKSRTNFSFASSAA
jgi:hypothetical protein